VSDLAEWLLACIAEDEERERSKWRKPRLDGRDCPCCGRTITGTIWNGSHERTWWTLEPCMHELSDEDVERIAPPVSAADPFVLADLAAKRRIVELHNGAHECPDAGDNCGWIDGDLRPYCDTLRLFGHALRHREGYDERWRPEE
jgi:hypothetical protein